MKSACVPLGRDVLFAHELTARTGVEGIDMTPFWRPHYYEQ
jgi:hypothetical protein